MRRTSRSLRGNVDRNEEAGQQKSDGQVVPYVGTWIEIVKSVPQTGSEQSRSLRGNVDRNGSV